MKSLIILCGGLSTRMGKDKGSMSYDGKPMVVHLIESLKQVADEILLVLRNESQYRIYKDMLSNYSIIENSEFKILMDTITDKGPLGGIYTGMNAINSEKAMVVPCDSPFISKELVSQLFEISEKYNEFNSFVPVWADGNMEPLHSIYPVSSHEIIEELLLKDQKSIKALIKRLNVKYIEIEEFNLPKKSFLNLNSPEDI
jgi:molybdenum cofactor guanylyltransferase